MFDDRIEITSVGGLSTGINKDSFLDGQVSVLRNYILANVFHRLDLIEKFGTGIIRIKESYSNAKNNPQFLILDDAIKVILPIIKDDI